MFILFKWAIPILLLFTCSNNHSSHLLSTDQKAEYKLAYMDNYDELWEKVEKFENEGKPRSAEEVVQQIYDLAKKDNNDPQTIKAVIFLAKYAADLNEDGMVVAINRLEKELETSKFPVDAVLHSYLGEIYKSYLSANTYRLRDRTGGAGAKTDDILTWAPEDFVEASGMHYKASLEHKELLDFDTELMDEILQGGNSKAPQFNKLYDMLLLRAVDNWADERSFLTESENAFSLKDKEAFATVAEFIHWDIPMPESPSKVYETLKFYQQALTHYRDMKRRDAMAYVDLRRLMFVHNESKHSEKDALYDTALTRMASEYEKEDIWSEITYRRALRLEQKAGQYDQYVSDDPNKWLLKEVLQMCDDAMEAFPESYGASLAANLRLRILSKSLNVQIEEVQLPKKPFRALVSFKNVDQAWYKIVRISESDREKMRNDQQDKILDKLLKMPIIRSEKIDLPEDGDYRSHSTEVAFDELDKGFYALVLSHDEGFEKAYNLIGYSFFHVSNLAFWTNQSEGVIDFIRIVDRESGDPVSGANVKIYERKYNRVLRKPEQKLINTYTSDKFGKVNGFPNKRSFNIRVEKNDDVFWHNDHFSSYSYNRNDKSYVRTYFFTDRSIYRPGQTIYFKGLSVNFDTKRIPDLLLNKKVTVKLIDVNGQKVEETNFELSEYGTFHGSFTAPDDRLLGNMRIVSDNGGSANVRIEEYKRPKFEVQMDSLAEAWKAGDDITINGNAKMYAGSAVDGADVSWVVTKQVMFPYWRFWLPPWIKQEKKQMASGKLKTDADGGFSLSFTSDPIEKSVRRFTPWYVYEINVDVTDINGETRSGSKQVQLGSSPYRLQSDIAQKSTITDFKSIDLKALNADGKSMETKGNCTIYRLTPPMTELKNRLWSRPDKHTITESEYRKMFPFDAYADEENMSTWQKETIGSIGFETPATMDVSKLDVNFNQGIYLFEFNLMGETDPLMSNYIQLYDPVSSDIITMAGVEILPQFTVVQPGDKADVLLKSKSQTQFIETCLEKSTKSGECGGIFVNNKSNYSSDVLESDRGGFGYFFTWVRNNRFYTESISVPVPWDNKKLDITFETFRDKTMPGAEEEVSMVIKGNDKEKVAAEMLATMYDASLDQFLAHNWNLSIYPTFYRYRQIRSTGFGMSHFARTSKNWNERVQPVNSEQYPQFNWFGLDMYGRHYYANDMMMDGVMMKSARPTRAGAPPEEMEAMEAPMAEARNGGMAEDEEQSPPPPTSEPGAETSAPPALRSDFNETVFFLPELRTDAEGNIRFTYKMRESLTKYKFLSFAHTKELAFAFAENEIITQKDLMVFPNLPRFVRQDDEIKLQVKVSNLSDKNIDGKAFIQLFNARTGEEITQQLLTTASNTPFETAISASDVATFGIKIPTDLFDPLSIKIWAQSANHSDGEEHLLPVLTNRMLVTESLPLPVKGHEKREFTFKSLESQNSSTAQPHRFTLEFSSNPAWYAVQALPYMMEYPYDCSEQIFSRFYANTLASGAANSNPKIKAVFAQWEEDAKTQSEHALMSNLSKNQELKAAMLAETPWVMQAKNEEEQKRNIGLLFDLDRMSKEAKKSIKILSERQLQSGGFAWFPGGRDSWYITQYMVEGFGHLKHLNIPFTQNDLSTKVFNKAVQYCDEELEEHYRRLERRVKKGEAKWEDDHLDHMVIHYLYARSFYKELPFTPELDKIRKYYFGQAEKYWLNKGIYMQGMLSLAMHRHDVRDKVPTMLESFQERALYHDELGMYWKYDRGYNWYQAPIETHALMIEVFMEINKDIETVNLLKTWLLKNKQTNNWKTTKGTAAAVYAFLMQGGNWLGSDGDVEIRLGGTKVKVADNEKQAGTGYFKKVYEKDDIGRNFHTLKVDNPNETIAWGAAYYQYFEQLDKIKTFEETPLTIKKELFIADLTNAGEKLRPLTEGDNLKVGDKLKVRIEIRVDRSMEYVHMKDMRASGLEPINVLSTYKWQGGLGYYESTGDVATNFFMGYLPRGTYVFEYPLRASIAGTYSNGITQIQCMYAPEFSSHSEGMVVEIE